MGAIGGGIWHGIKGARNSPRVGLLSIFRRWTWSSDLPVRSFAPAVLGAQPATVARQGGETKLIILGRTSDRFGVCYKSTSTSPRRELWDLGRTVLILRLRGEGVQAEGGSVECDHFGVLDGWKFGAAR